MSALRVVLAGGTGQVGTLLARHFREAGHSVTVVSRSPQSLPWPVVQWDGQTLGAWASSLEGTDVLINVAGRSVNCRYTPTNRRSIMDSRINSTRVLGEAVAGLANPPRVWMNAS